MNTFEPTHLPERGITLLEASAGTGKTYSIVNIVLQLVALRGVPLAEILLVTFTRNATAELRERVRKRLAVGLAAASLPSDGPAPTDAVLAQVWRAGQADSDVATRLHRALESFDECVIRTIHGFCQRMLQQFAALAGADVDLELDPNAPDLLDDLVDDWLSRELYPHDADRYGFLVHHAGYTRSFLLNIARTVVGNPVMGIEPAPGDGLGTLRAMRARVSAAWTSSWRDELLSVLTAAHADKRFNKGQRTYTPKTFPALLADVDAWLASEDPLSAPGKDASKLLSDALGGKVSGPPIAHEALTALDELAALPARAGAMDTARFAHWVRQAFQTACLVERVQSYPDLVRGLADRVAPGAPEPARQALIDAIGGTFQAALIDEFQDTDDAQWTLFREVFGQGDHWLYLIGDPKQAIYGFRGANVHVYLQARDSAGERVFTMTRNHRSDQVVLDGLNHVMNQPGFFGNTGIDYVYVDAPARHQGSRLCWPDGTSKARQAPVQLRYINAPEFGSTKTGALPKGAAEPDAARAVATDITELLSAPPTLDGRPLRPSDVAVLVRTSRQGDLVQNALTQAGVPAVQSGRHSVFTSAAARDLQLWLIALSQPGRDGAARAAATTRLFGHTADILLGIEAEDPHSLREWDAWLGSLAEWRELLSRFSFLRALRQAMAQEQVSERILRHPGGERYLTDLLHTAELIHTAQVTDELQMMGLVAWLTERRHEADSNNEAAEVRLERDDEAVTVMTLHKSKGLQFPVVFVPFAWAEPGVRKPIIAPGEHDPAVRVLDLTASDDSKERAVLAGAQEALRLFYVGLTRAEVRVVLYSGHVTSLPTSACAPALHGVSPDRIASGWERTDAVLKGDGVELWDDLCTLCTPGALTLSTVDPADDAATYRPPEVSTEHLRARRFTRDGLDTLWKRYSYTALTRNQAVTYAVPEAREGFDADRIVTPRVIDARPALAPADDAPDVPLAAFPAGAKAGIFLHEVFENADFQAPDALPEVIDALIGRHGIEPDLAEPLAAGLAAVLDTPLGGPLDSVRLADVSKRDRLDELRFDFPLAGGDAWGKPSRRSVQSSEILAAIADQPASDALRPEYLGGLSAMDLGTLAGFMTGSIDLVFRATVPTESAPRWFVADYKSNRIDPHRSRRWPVEHFALSSMRYEMEQHHYYLQYHLYTLALHRYLRWRVPDYDYDTHMGGSYYLFFRGMIGPETPKQGDGVSGCFFHRPPASVIHALDAAFDAAEVP